MICRTVGMFTMAGVLIFGGISITYALISSLEAPVRIAQNKLGSETRDPVNVADQNNEECLAQGSLVDGRMVDYDASKSPGAIYCATPSSPVTPVAPAAAAAILAISCTPPNVPTVNFYGKPCTYVHEVIGPAVKATCFHSKKCRANSFLDQHGVEHEVSEKVGVVGDLSNTIVVNRYMPEGFTPSTMPLPNQGNITDAFKPGEAKTPSSGQAANLSPGERLTPGPTSPTYLPQPSSPPPTMGPPKQLAPAQTGSGAGSAGAQLPPAEGKQTPQTFAGGQRSIAQPTDQQSTGQSTQTQQQGSNWTSNIGPALQNVTQPVQDFYGQAAQNFFRPALSAMSNLMSPAISQFVPLVGSGGGFAPAGAGVGGGFGGVAATTSAQSSIQVPAAQIVPEIKLPAQATSLQELLRLARATGEQPRAAAGETGNVGLDTAFEPRADDEEVLIIEREPQPALTESYVELSTRDLGRPMFTFVQLETEEDLVLRISHLSQPNAVGVGVPLDKPNIQIAANNMSDIDLLEASRIDAQVRGFISQANFLRIAEGRAGQVEIPFTPAIARVTPLEQLPAMVRASAPVLFPSDASGFGTRIGDTGDNANGILIRVRTVIGNLLGRLF